MESNTAVKIFYWAEQIDEYKLDDLACIDEFKQELDKHYVAVTHARPGDLGGLLHLTVEFISSISITDVVKFLAGGMAYDVMKEGTKAFVLRPFLDAYQKLKDKNPDSGVDIESLKITFQDSVLIIYRLDDHSIVENVQSILEAVAQNYEGLVLHSGELPYEIHIPVYEDLSKDRFSRYRVLLNVDETIKPNSQVDYLKLWGLWYDFSRVSRVYDVERQLRLDEEFLTQEWYDIEWQRMYGTNR